MTDAAAVARRLCDAQAARQLVAPPSTEDPAFDLTAAYAVERAITRLRRDGGHQVVGRKVGYANKAVWRIKKLDTLVWASMYDDTVECAGTGQATLSIVPLVAPKLEPEIVFKLRQPIAARASDAGAALASAEWLALGFEIIDCPYPDWTFEPVDFVAAGGLHARLIVGAPQPVTADRMATLVDQLATFKVRLSCDDRLVDEGSGRNALRSPALSLAELAAALGRRPDAEPLAAGELVSSGTLTESHRIATGETWRATLHGLDVDALTVRVT